MSETEASNEGLGEEEVKPAPTAHNPIWHFAAGGKDVVEISRNLIICNSSNSQQVPEIARVVLSIGGTCGSVLTTPLDVVKTRMQSSRPTSAVAEAQLRGNIFTQTWGALTGIYQKEGVRGLFKGVGPNLVGVAPSRAIYFASYSTVKDALTGITGRESPLIHMTSAAGSGMLVATIMNPLWVVKTRLQLQEDLFKASHEQHSIKSSPSSSSSSIPPSQPPSSSSRSFSTLSQASSSSSSSPSSSSHILQRIRSFASTVSVSSKSYVPYSSYADCLKRIIKEEGFKSLYRGMTASYLGVLEGATYFVVYEYFKKFLAKKGDGQPFQNSFVAALQFIGMTSGAKLIASALTYPHELLRTRMREVNAAEKYNTLVQAFKTVMKEEGARGLYNGMGVHLIRVVPNTAIMFFTYEYIVHFLERNGGKLPW